MKPYIVESNSKEIVLQQLDTIPQREYQIGDDSDLTIVVFTSGTRDIAGNVHIRLMGTRSKATIIGVFITKKNQVISLHTLQHHEARETTSNLLVKAVLKDTSQFSYDGAIRVEYEGQKTDAYQRNENLIMSPNAYAQSKPSLEILADDVRCTHGATVGNVNQEQLFYLKSRGMTDEVGTSLIIEGFLNDAIEKIQDSALEEQIKKAVWQNI